MEQIISSLPHGLDVNFGYCTHGRFMCLLTFLVLVLSSCLVALFPEYIPSLCGSVNFSALSINWQCLYMVQITGTNFCF